MGREASLMRMRIGSKQLIREINQAIVLDTVRNLGMASRAEIASLTGLSQATVSGITGELIARDLLIESAIGKSAGGRRPVLLEFNASAGYVIGVKVTEAEVVAVLTDLEATVVERERMALERRGVVDVVDAIEAAAIELMAKDGNRPVHGVGVGLAGVVDSTRGVVAYATYLDWRDEPIGDLLEERLGLPVTVDNDVNALAATAQWFGAGRQVANMLVVSLGRGVGLGLVLNGQLYRGSSGGAGEFGHVKISDDGPACDCGSNGCLEAMVSDPAIARDVSARLGRQVEIDEAIELARAGSAAAVEVFGAAAEALAVALANLVNVLNPELVVISGEGAVAADLLRPALDHALAEYCFDGLGDGVEIVVEPWEDEAWARGAASLLLGELFEPTLRLQPSRRPSLASRSA